MAGLAALAADLGHVLAVLADLLAAFLADLGHMLAVFADLFAALLADVGHVLAVAAHGLASGAMRILLVRHVTAFSSNFSVVFDLPCRRLARADRGRTRRCPPTHAPLVARAPILPSPYAFPRPS